MVSEAEIVWHLKKHLQVNGLGTSKWPVLNIAVDSDGSYRQFEKASDLEPMMPMPICGFYPDLVCYYSHPNEEGLAAFEVKRQFVDWTKGITQARVYREGVHRSYLALPSGSGRRLRSLEKDALECGVGVLLYDDCKWIEIVPSASPRPIPSESKNLTNAIRGVVLPRRLQLNHPLNYLAVAWAKSRMPDENISSSLEKCWADLRTDGSRQHAINGAQYLGLLKKDGSLTELGHVVTDLMESLNFGCNQKINKRKRFFIESPGLAGIARFVLMQTESTKIIVQTLLRSGNKKMNTEELLWKAMEVNRPLASGLFLAEPSLLESQIVPASGFCPSFVFQFKQVLWHTGILSCSIHKSAGRGNSIYDAKKDIWQLEERL